MSRKFIDERTKTIKDFIKTQSDISTTLMKNEILQTNFQKRSFQKEDFTDLELMFNCDSDFIEAEFNRLKEHGYCGDQFQS